MIKELNDLLESGKDIIGVYPELKLTKDGVFNGVDVRLSVFRNGKFVHNKYYYCDEFLKCAIDPDMMFTTKFKTACHALKERLENEN